MRGIVFTYIWINLRAAMTHREDTDNQFNKIKLMYDNVYDELNRSRDWPIKIMAFATAGDLAIYGLIKFTDTFCIGNWIKIILSLLVTALAFFTIFNIYNQDTQYKKYRKVQRKMQRWLEIHHFKIDDQEIFPTEWSKIEELPQKNWLYRFLAGWPFYVVYIVVLLIIALLLIWH